MIDRATGPLIFTLVDAFARGAVERGGCAVDELRLVDVLGGGCGGDVAVRGGREARKNDVIFSRRMRREDEVEVAESGPELRKGRRAGARALEAAR